MFGNIWNHDTIRKYIIYFGTLFSDVMLSRGDGDIPDQLMKVPIQYGPREKFLSRSEGNPDLERPIAIQLPRMAFEMTNMVYDPERKIISAKKLRSVGSDPNQMNYQHTPTPYNFTFELNIMVKNAIDGVRIVEQILPFFSPDFMGTLNINNLGGGWDVPLTLNSVVRTDTYEGSYEQRRTHIWTLTFTMKGWFFGPTKSGEVIKQVEVYFRIPKPGHTMYEAVGNTPSVLDIIITPGLTPDGKPTSNPAESIDKAFIVATDDYGFIEEFTETI